MQDGYDLDLMCFDEATPFPPSGIDLSAFLELVENIAEDCAKLAETLGRIIGSAAAGLVQVLEEFLDSVKEATQRKPLPKPLRRIGRPFGLSCHNDRVPWYTSGFL